MKRYTPKFALLVITLSVVFLGITYWLIQIIPGYVLKSPPSDIESPDVEVELAEANETDIVVSVADDSLQDKDQTIDVVTTEETIDEAISLAKQEKEDGEFFENFVGGENVGNNYKVYKGKVYFYGQGRHGTESVVKRVDLNAEEVSSFNSGRCWYRNSEGFIRQWICGEFAKDSENVFRGESKVEGADPNSFEVLRISENNRKPIYFKDDYKVFYGVYDLEELEGADSKSFHLLSDIYARDERMIYHDDKELKNVDPETFQALEYDYGKDKKTVYYRGGRLKDADPDTFIVLSEDYAKDKSTVYGGEGRLKTIDPDSLVVLSEDYIKDKDAVYHNEDKINGADPESFTFIVGDYARDNNTIYDHGDRIEGVDVASFQVLFDSYSKDINFVYFEGDRIEDADIESFTVLSDDYAKDKKFVYYGEERFNGADPETFQLPR